MYLLEKGEKIKFTRNELGDILESLEYSRMNFENYGGYPSYEFRQKILSNNHNLTVKVRKMRNAAKASIKLPIEIINDDNGAVK